MQGISGKPHYPLSFLADGNHRVSNLKRRIGKPVGPGLASARSRLRGLALAAIPGVRSCGHATQARVDVNPRHFS